MEQKTEAKETKPKGKEEINYEGKLVRILSKDIDARNKVYHGLTKIKGISWSVANAICKILKIDKSKKIGALTNEEIQKISDFMKNPKFPAYLFNRRKDFESGENKHMLSTTLELQHEFDIKRLKKIRSYKGYRHAMGLPVRGQRTRGHFRKNKSRGVGIKKKTKKEVKEPIRG